MASHDLPNGADQADAPVRRSTALLLGPGQEDDLVERTWRRHVTVARRP